MASLKILKIGCSIIFLWMFTAPTLSAQGGYTVPGTYVMIEKIGVHVKGGLSFGDTHVTSYISYVDTTVTHTLTLDSSHQACLINDTSFHIAVGYIPEPVLKMTGSWILQEDTLVVQLTGIDSLYHLSYLKDTIVGSSDGTEYRILPDGGVVSSGVLWNPVQIRFKIFSVEKEIYALQPLNENRHWIVFRKQ